MSISNKQNAIAPSRMSTGSFVPSTLFQIDRFRDPMMETLDQIIQEVFGNTSRIRDITKNRVDYPKTDIIQTDDNLIFKMAVPGLEKEDVSVELKEIDGYDTISVKGSKTTETDDVHFVGTGNENVSKRSFLQRELKHSSFDRSWIIGLIEQWFPGSGGSSGSSLPPLSDNDAESAGQTAGESFASSFLDNLQTYLPNLTITGIAASPVSMPIMTRDVNNSRSVNVEVNAAYKNYESEAGIYYDVSAALAGARS